MYLTISRRRVPDAELLAQFRVERFQERLVEVLHRLGVLEFGEERCALDAVERVGSPVHDFGEVVPFIEMGGICQGMEETRRIGTCK